MKIAYIIQYFGSPSNSFASGRSWDFATLWASQGHSVWVICSDAYFLDKNKRDDLQLNDNLTVTVIPQPYSNSYSIGKRAFAFLGFACKALLLLLKKPTEFDVILASSTPLSVGFVGYIQKIFTNKPWIFELRDLWPDFPVQAIPIKNKLIKNILFQIEQRLYKSASEIVCLSPVVQQLLHHQKKIPVDKIHFIPNGFSDPKPNNVFTQQHNFGKPIVMYEGALGKANGVTWLLDYFSHLLKISDQATIILAGFGAENKRIVRWQQALPLEQKKRVQLLGTISRASISDWLHIADFSLVTFSDWPILQTNSPNKLFDALGHSITLITNTEGWIAQLTEKSGGFVETNAKTAAERTLQKILPNTLKVKHNFNEYKRSNLAEKMLKIIQKCG